MEISNCSEMSYTTFSSRVTRRCAFPRFMNFNLNGLKLQRPRFSKFKFQFIFGNGLKFHSSGIFATEVSDQFSTKEKRIQNILIYYSKKNVRKRRKVRISVHLLSSPPPFLVAKGAEREKRTRFSFIPPHPAVNAFYGSLSCVTISEAQMGGKNRHRISPFVSICGFLFPIFCSILWTAEKGTQSATLTATKPGNFKDKNLGKNI